MGWARRARSGLCRLCARVCARGVWWLGHERVLVATWLWAHVCLCVAAEGSVSSAQTSPRSFAGTNGGLVVADGPTSPPHSPHRGRMLQHCSSSSSLCTSLQPGPGGHEHCFKSCNTLKYIHSKVLGMAKGCTGRSHPTPVPSWRGLRPSRLLQIPCFANGAGGFGQAGFNNPRALKPAPKHRIWERQVGVQEALAGFL